MDAERNGMISLNKEGVTPGREERSDERAGVTAAAPRPAPDPEARDEGSTAGSARGLRQYALGHAFPGSSGEAGSWPKSVPRRRRGVPS